MVMPNIINARLFCLGTLGALISVLGMTILFTWPSIFKYILHSQLEISEGSRTFALWRDTPVPMYMNFYFHNWTNPHELNKEKPIFEQMGPYRFNIEEKKTNIVMNTNGTVTFRIARKWFFDAEKSNGTLKDVVTTLNAVVLSAASTAKDWSIFMTTPLSLTIKNTKQKIYIQKSVGDLLFFGYNDKLIDMAATLPAFMGVDIPFDKFAWFYKRNESSDFEGTFNMDTGVHNINYFGKLYNWNYKNSTGFYEGTCGMINGSAGELFPPKQTKEKGIQFFTPDVCRTLTLPFGEEQEIHGLKGYKYVGNEYTFDNGTLNEDNECFCNGLCSPSGVLNVTSCRYDAPGFISFPHFHLADEFYHNHVGGMKPDADKHTMYITLEPETGIPLDVAARFQINLLLRPIERISLFANVPTIYFPMIWFEQRATITENLAFQVRLALAGPLIGTIISVIFMIIGIIMFIYYLYQILSLSKSTKETVFDLREQPVIKPLLKGGKNKIQNSQINQLAGDVP